MELLNFDGLTLGSIIAGLVPAPLLLLFSRLAAWVMANRITGRFAFLAANKFSWRLVLALLAASSVAGLVYILSPTLLGKALNVSFVWAMTLAILVTYPQWRFALVGLHAAQSSVARGTDYQAALHLCRNGFSLLGTGASKLTSAKNFEETILRCDQGTIPVRFLLSKPDNKLIANAEDRADVQTGTYKRNIVRSLKTLKKLKTERNAKFEVRFYKGETDSDFENFRAMFIDDEILLLSYNVYGRGDGRDAPQLVIFKSQLLSASDGFYQSFHSYFEQLWSSSEPWDFKKYV
jgi:hypothetical protein